MKADFINSQFQQIRNFVDEHRGMSKDLINCKEYEDYLKAMEAIKLFNGMSVVLTFSAEMDFLSVKNGTKKGKIKVVEDKIRFYEGRKTVKFYYLDAGLYLGWFATLIPNKITATQ